MCEKCATMRIFKPIMLAIKKEAVENNEEQYKIDNVQKQLDTIEEHLANCSDKPSPVVIQCQPVRMFGKTKGGQ